MNGHSSPTKHSGYRPDVDGLRAVAVGVVLLFHAGFGELAGGYVGVDVFFVISGYVITLSIVKMLQDGTFTVQEFYYRRVRRIMPALFFTLALTSIAAYTLFIPSFFEDYLKSLISSVFFVSNHYFWSTSNYFNAASDLKPLLHTWSLSVEEQYYIFMPLYMAFIYKIATNRTLLNTLFGRVQFLRNVSPSKLIWLLAFYIPIFASFVLSVYMMDRAASANYYLLPTRVWELLIGAVIAIAPPVTVTKKWQSFALGVIGLLAIVVASFVFNKETPFPGYTALLPCLGAAMIIVAGQLDQSYTRWSVNPVGKLLASKPVVYIGLLSYSLYLVHWPVTVFFKYQSLAPLTLINSMTIVAISFVLAMISYHLIEVPFRYKVKQTKSQAFRFALIGLFSFAAIGGSTLYFSPQIQDDVDIANTKKAEPTCFYLNAKKHTSWSTQNCQLLSSVSGENVLIWGDSFLNHYTEGFINQKESLDINLFKYSSAGCPPILSFRSFALPYCDEFNKNALNIIKENNIGYVILSARWTDYKKKGLNELQTTLVELDKLGVEYLIIGQSPQFITDVAIINKQKGEGRETHSWPITFDRSINTELKHYAPSSFIDPLPYLCDGQKCLYKQNGQLLYTDYGHLSQYGSDLLIKSMLHPINDWLSR